MTQQHPITPPPELVQQWMTEARSQDYCSITEQVAFHAAQWGADHELEACCEWLEREGWSGESRQLRAARRLRPPSLKRVALLQLDTLNADLGLEGKSVDLSQIRRALEQLDD